MCTVLLLPRRPLLYTGFGICRPFIFKLASVRPDRRVPRVRTSHRNVSALWPLRHRELSAHQKYVASGKKRRGVIQAQSRPQQGRPVTMEIASAPPVRVPAAQTFRRPCSACAARCRP